MAKSKVKLRDASDQVKEFARRTHSKFEFRSEFKFADMLEHAIFDKSSKQITVIVKGKQFRWTVK